MEVSCALQRGIGLMYARSNQNIARMSGRQFMPGCHVPVQEEALLYEPRSRRLKTSMGVYPSGRRRLKIQD